MRSYLHRTLFAGLATITVACVPVTSEARPTVRDHRGPVADGGPREAPPPARSERAPGQRRGFVWVDGHWDWRRGRWEWVAGHWERERAGRRWRPHRWERRGDVYVRIDGDWIDAPAYPTAAPPPPREERLETRRGFVWVRGHWDWRNGDWAWVPGHWERERASQRWIEGRWELRGDRWEWIAGRWETGDQAPRQPPPPPRFERPQSRPGHAWIPGYYRWDNGRYSWVPGRLEAGHAGERFVPGEWTLRGDVYVYNSGQWVKDQPTSPPPREPFERPQSRPGYGWIPGYYRWVDGRYQWVPGRLEAGHAGERFIPGQWTLRGGVYVYNSGQWVRDNAAPPPRPPNNPPPPPYTNPPPPSSGPTNPPPPPREERPETRAGFVWARGHYEWRNGRYEWIPGHWERQRARLTWQDAKWELRGNVWVFVPGGWR